MAFAFSTIMFYLPHRYMPASYVLRFDGLFARRNLMFFIRYGAC